MPSEKATKILKSKSDLTEEQINKMTDHEAWAWIYNNKQTKKPRDTRSQICFTGFRPYEKERLFKIANDAGFKIVQSVTQRLDFLCVGDEPGPAKIQKAKEHNVTIINESEFLNILKNGEI